MYRVQSKEGVLEGALALKANSQNFLHKKLLPLNFRFDGFLALWLFSKTTLPNLGFWFHSNEWVVGIFPA